MLRGPIRLANWSCGVGGESNERKASWWRRRRIASIACWLAQQVYLQLFRQIHQFSGDSSFGTWLYRVTINEAMQHLRRNRRRRFAILSWEPEDYKADRNRQSEAGELLDRALTGLEPELRSVFVLREVEQLSYEEIGGALGIPIGTVASRLSRARHDLQERLRSLGWDG
jgi:RNA polymerase sigma-70 factor (ECF subfamily)